MSEARAGGLDWLAAVAAWLLALLCAIAPLTSHLRPIVFDPPYLVLLALWAGLVALLIQRRRWWWMLLSALPALWAIGLYSGVILLCSAFGCH